MITGRRELLQMLSALGVGLTLPAMSVRAAALRRTERPRSVITLWMNGGMSQLETWDPHPGTKTGGDVKDIATSAEGVRISSLLPAMAEEMKSCLLIRSLTSKEGDHERGTAYVRTGYRPEPTLKYPTLGAILARELPVSSLEIPSYISVASPQSVPEGGYLGNQWDAFRLFNPGEDLANLATTVDEQRQKDRLKGLEIVSGEFARKRRVSADATLHQQTMNRALQMMTSEQLKAFRLDEETGATRAAYGATSFGRGCLLARRLVETGVRAVDVTLSGFDTHVSNHEGHIVQCRILDPAISTLIRELRERDLLQSTIVLCISEFGRTPAINPAGGRDHWPNWFSCLVAGGGFRQGAVIGATSSELPSEKPAPPSDPVSIPQLYATIMSQMGIDPSRELLTPIGRPMRFADATSDERLLS